MEEIKQGYKQTDIGVIPEDWEVRPIGEVLKITTGNRNTQDKKDDGLYPFFVRSQIVERINSYSFDGEAVLTAGDGVGTGKVFHYINGKFDYHQRVYLVHGFDDKIIGKYFYWFFSKYFFERINQLTAKSSVDSVRREMIADMLVPLPKKVEQTSIATALSDTDALIAALDKKIAKKQQIKQGAMQQLLTGKKRLPGFSGEWVEKKFGELLDYEQPTDYIVKSTDYLTQGIPVLTAGKSFILGYTAETTGIFTNSPVIIFDDFTTATKFVDFKFKVKSSAMKILKLRESNNSIKLIYELMQLIDFPLIDHQRYWISEYSKIIVKIPATSEEQTVIAQILTDMDNEIAQIEKERDKYKKIKAGMMQVLLTGKVRLV